MGTIAFLPWVSFNQDFSLGGFKFTRVRKQYRNLDNNPPYIDQIANLPQPYDQIVNCTRIKNNASISDFTVINKTGQSLIDDLTDDDIKNLYKIIDYITCSAISSRDITGHDYVNADNLALIVQRFDRIPIRHISISTKRRGSTAWNAYPINLYGMRCPEHVSNQKGYKLDIGFSTAVYDHIAQKKQGYQRLDDSIENYVLANTDYGRVGENSEFVLLSGAFERLIKSNGKAQVFRYQLSKVLRFVPEQDVNCTAKNLPKAQDGWRREVCRLTNGKLCLKKPFDSCKTLRDYWAIDFYRTRNKFAHGEGRSNNSIWSAQEHLAISCHIFPSLVKIYLRDKGNFALRNFEDNRKLYQIDFLLMRDDLLVEDQNLITGWGHARQDAALNSDTTFPII